MGNLLLGFIMGIVVSSVGFTGLAKIADQGVDRVKGVSEVVTK